MLRHYKDALNKPQRVLPIVWVNEIRRSQRRPREYPCGCQDALALPPDRLPQIQPAHSQYHRRQHQPKHAQIYRQAHAYPAQQKRSDSVLAKRAVSEIQRDNQHRRERNILAVKERVGIQARMQQKQQHSQQRYPTTAQRPIREHPARKAPRDKEQVRKQVARQIDMAAVIQPERPRNQKQRHLKGNAVVAMNPVAVIFVIV